MFVSDEYHRRFLKQLPIPLTENSCLEDKSSLPASFPCDACGRAYNRKGNLLRHKRYECGKAPQFPCQFCDKSFVRREKLEYHCKVHFLDGNEWASYFRK